MLVDRNSALTKHAVIVQEMKEKFGSHPIGAILLAMHLYEACRSTRGGYAWDLMCELAKKKSWTSEVWHQVAQNILED